MADKVEIVSRFVDDLHDSWGDEVKAVYGNFVTKARAVDRYSVVLSQSQYRNLNKIMTEPADAGRRSWALKWLNRMVEAIGVCNRLVPSGSSYIASSAGLAYTL